MKFEVVSTLKWILFFAVWCGILLGSIMMWWVMPFPIDIYRLVLYCVFTPQSQVRGGLSATNILPRDILYVPVTFKVVVVGYCHSICHICYLFIFLKPKKVFFGLFFFLTVSQFVIQAILWLIWNWFGSLLKGLRLAIIVIGRNTLTYVLLK